MKIKVEICARRGMKDGEVMPYQGRIEMLEEGLEIPSKDVFWTDGKEIYEVSIEGQKMRGGYDRVVSYFGSYENCKEWTGQMIEKTQREIERWEKIFPKDDEKEIYMWDKESKTLVEIGDTEE